MNILLTNDDGLESRGIWALYNHLKKKHNVAMVVPDQDKSGCSHSFTLKTPIRVKKLKENIFICFNSPVDCIFIAVKGLLPWKPDFILSGINPGPNMGTDIIYSGTAAAAREGAMKGIPAASLSVLRKIPPFEFKPVLDFIDDNLNELYVNWDSSFFYNINFPEKYASDYKIKDTYPGYRIYHDTVTVVSSDNNESYFFVKGEKIDSSDDPLSDTGAVYEGHISVSKVTILPSAVKDTEEVKKIG